MTTAEADRRIRTQKREDLFGFKSRSFDFSFSFFSGLRKKMRIIIIKILVDLKFEGAS